MKTNAPQRTRADRTEHDAGAVADRSRGLLAAALTRLQQGICSLHGHDSLLQYERNRLYLRCASCGYESPGWEVARRSSDRGELPVPVGSGGDLVVARKVA